MIKSAFTNEELFDTKTNLRDAIARKWRAEKLANEERDDELEYLQMLKDKQLLNRNYGSIMRGDEAI